MKFDTLPSKEIIEKTMGALNANVVASKIEKGESLSSPCKQLF